MLKNGYYAIYRGKEYRVNHDKSKKIHLYTNDKEKIDGSFVMWRKTEFQESYEKIVQPYELDDVYDITTFAYVDENKRFVVIRETEDMYLVGTGSKNIDLVEKYKLKEVDRRIFEGWIHKDDVCLVEERKDMTRQFGVVKKTD